MDVDMVHGPELTGPERLELAFSLELLSHRFERCRAACLAAKDADPETRSRLGQTLVRTANEYETVMKLISLRIAAHASGPRSLDQELYEWVGISADEYDLAVAYLLAHAEEVDDA